MSDAPLYRRLALVGVGLIGSSIALAARRAGLAGEIAVFTPREDERAIAISRQLADEYPLSLALCVAGADLVILATPVGAFGEIAVVIAPHLAPGATLTDVGSVKECAVRDITPHVPSGVHFIPGHPIASTAQSGPAAGCAKVFDGRWCILTPLPGADETALDRLKAFWFGLGSQVEIMSAARHDLVLAITSHVPHLIAFNIVATAADLETITSSEVIKFSAGGFRDFTRLAASDPVMWRDVFLNNRDAVLEILGRFNEDLAALQRAIRWGDGAQLHEVFTRARATRRKVIEAGQETPEPDFGRPHGEGG